MKATFNEFITRVKTVGLPSPTHFHIRIDGESKLNLMLCESITLPGFNVMTEENRIYGELTEMPTAPIYNAVTATFIMDNNAQPRTFFIDWLNKVFDRKTRALGYYADYVKDVDIFITNKAGGSILKTTLFECYPKSVQDVELSYSGDHIVKFTVAFIYKWASELKEQQTGGSSSTGSGSQQSQPSLTTQLGKTISGMPIGGIIDQQTQGIFNSITDVLPPSMIPEVQIFFDPENLSFGISIISDDISLEIGASQNSLFAAISISGLSQEDIDNIENILLDVERGARLLSDSFSSLQQDDTGYVDTFENRVSIGDSIINLGETMLQIENMLSILESPVDLSDLADEMQQIGLNIKLANQAADVNQQLSSFGSVFSAAGSALEIASNQIPGQFSAPTRSGVNELSSQFMQIGLNISALQAAL